MTPSPAQSGRQDLNLRPLPPQGSALPGCATSRASLPTPVRTPGVELPGHSHVRRTIVLRSLTANLHPRPHLRHHLPPNHAILLTIGTWPGDSPPPPLPRACTHGGRVLTLPHGPRRPPNRDAGARNRFNTAERRSADATRTCASNRKIRGPRWSSTKALPRARALSPPGLHGDLDRDGGVQRRHLDVRAAAAG